MPLPYQSETWNLQNQHLPYRRRPYRKSASTASTESTGAMMECRVPMCLHRVRGRGLGKAQTRQWLGLGIVE
jgi:hypothetical protein